MILNNNQYFTKEVLATLISATGIGFWVWDFELETLNLSDEFFKIVGYEAGDVVGSFEKWAQMVHSEDRATVINKLNDFREGKTDQYLSEFRIVKKNGEIIWVQDRGQFIKFKEDGTPLQMAAIIQNITLRKEMEQRLREKQRKLKLAMSFAGLGVWEWNIPEDFIVYSEEYIEKLGYKADEVGTDSNFWDPMIHPEDAVKLHKKAKNLLVNGESGYKMKLRMKKADGSYLWVKDIGEVVERDAEGRPIKMIGGCLDIDDLERATIQLEHYQDDLEAEIQHRTEALQWQDNLLMEITKISQKLMTTPKGDHFNEVVFACMEELTSVSHSSRLGIFRNKMVNGRPYCYLANHLINHESIFRSEFSVEEVADLFEGEDVSVASGGVFSQESAEDFHKFLVDVAEKTDFDNLDYQESLPSFYKALEENKVLNARAAELSPKEYTFLHMQGIRSILLSPITINNESWGFIVMDDCVERSFSPEEEKMISLAGSVFAQAIHQNETEIATQEAIEHGKLMIDATPICCNLWLSDGRNVDCSNESVRLFDLASQQEYLDKFHLLSPELQPCGRESMELAAEMVEIARQTGHHRFQWLHQKLNGEPIPCEITLVRIKHKNDFAVAGYTRDLREEKAMLAAIEENQEHLRQAHEEAVMASKAKSNFLANMSHEIRTPMNAISGMTDIILRETEKTEVSEYAHNIKRACDSLLSIINDVLDISKIESGKLDIVEGEYVLSDILNDVINIANARLEAKSLMFVTNFQHNLPNKLLGDEIRVKQVVVNILNNAIKFTHAGHIQLDVNGEYGDGEVKLNFVVSDTGTGISSEDMEKLFIEFERVNTTKNRTIEGTGLGLAISKRLCEMMDGTIEVRSEIGVGSTFTVSINQKYSEYIPLAEIEKSHSVLIFETRDVYRQSFERACGELDIFSVGCALQSEFNEALNEREFDFVFTSCMYLAKVEEMLERHHLQAKIVLLADTADIKAKYDYATIILPSNTLSIANVLNGKIYSNDDNESFINFTAPACHILVVDDNLVNLKVAKGLMKPYKFQISTAENGQEAVEMVQKNHYDMVFMDHMMPIMDGIDATIAIRNMEEKRLQNLPIVALTANAIIGTKEMFLKEGMSDFLAKPIKLTTLHEILGKWLPDEKKILESNTEETEIENQREIKIDCVDTMLGVQRVGGDFDTYIDILNMYYKDGVKRTTSILNFFKEKQLLDYKIEVHALKSASASIGALDISERARLLEESAIHEDWVFINQNTTEFLADFNILLENIRNSTKEFTYEEDFSGKSMGEQSFYEEILKELEEALDCVDINQCDKFLEDLYVYNWSEEKLEQLAKIKEFIRGYEYDEAVEFIQEILG